MTVRNAITDVPGFRVGHTQRSGDGWLTGVTVVVPPAEGAVAGVDVRGGGPGTRETDLLDPRNLVERVHAVVLAGGSALGLAAADGVAQALLSQGVGFPVGPEPGHVVPIVPAAVIFDLGRGGDFGRHPDAAMGREAFAAATVDAPEGTVGAGTGARVGGLKGGIGTVSQRLPDGSVLGALAVVNAVGCAVDPATGGLYAARHCRPGDLPDLGLPSTDEVAAARDRAEALPEPRPPLATTLVVLATDAKLTKAQCAKVSGLGHDGLARAITPAHTMWDGDTVFTLATGAAAAPDPAGFHVVLTEAADCVTRAVARAVVSATSAGDLRSYRDAFPSAFG